VDVGLAGFFFFPSPAPSTVVELDTNLFSLSKQRFPSERPRKVVSWVKLLFCISINSVYSKHRSYLSLSLPFFPGKRSAVELFTKGVLGKSS